MKEIYNKEDVEKMADNFCKKTVEKLKDDLLDGVYEDVSNYLHEHYQNFHERVERDLIMSICEEYVKDPAQYKFADLRKKMFNENKEELTKILTDEAIEKSVEDVIKQYTHRDYHFSWQWEVAIARIILKHIDEFAGSERVQNAFKRENDRLKDINIRLKQQLEDIRDITE